MWKIVRSNSVLGLLVASLCVSVGCSMDPPDNGVQIKVEQTLTDSQQDVLETRLKSLMEGGSTSYSTMVINGKMTINLSPVDSPEDFASKITFAETVSVVGNVIDLKVDLSKL